MKNIIPYNPSFELGKGFNSLKGEALGTIFQPDLEYSDPKVLKAKKLISK